MYNFSAGPSVLPYEVLKELSEACLDYNHTGISITGLGHRTLEFESIIRGAQDLFHELLDIPQRYHVLFLQGGATMQFSMVPLNFLRSRAAYLDSGVWSQKAIKEARRIGEVLVVGSSAAQGYRELPSDYDIPHDADYLHYTSNNTIYGTEFLDEIKSDIPLISDMSSDILSRPLEIEKYALIYGGGQKNLSMAGMTFAIVDPDRLPAISDRYIPSLLDYGNHINAHDILNTVPVTAIYTAYLVLKWIKAKGGVKRMETLAIEKSEMLYAAIDRSKKFKCCVDKKSDRSRMNVCFELQDKLSSEENFINFALEHGIYGIKGHRASGGLRASLYNAMSIEGVESLVKAIETFDRQSILTP